MIDIHTHVLPGVDDGPGNFVESLEMLKVGMRDGIHGVVCTSHVLNRLTPDIEQTFQEKFRKLKELVADEGLGISLWLGSEIMCTASFDLRSPIATINNNGKYLLIELPMGQLPAGVDEVFFNLSLEGIVPILAHPARNAVIQQRPRLVHEFINRGVLMQINSGSVTGVFGKKARQTALLLLEHNLVHLVASDCHSVVSRPMHLRKCHGFIQNKFGSDLARDLFFTNPSKAVAGEDIDIREPVVPSKKSFLSRLFKTRENRS